MIDVGTSEQMPFLHQSFGARARYVALSHCWGSNVDAQVPKTATSTMHAREAGIAWSDLSQTFQDAIFITR